MKEFGYKKIDKQSITISIPDMVKNMMRHKIKLICSSICFAALVMLLLLVLNKNRNLEMPQIPEGIVETLENNEKILLDNEKMYNDQIMYNENAIYQKLDYEAVDTIVIQYWIDADKEKVFDVLVAYVDYYNNAFFSDIIEKNTELENGYLKDVINMTYNINSQYDVASTITFTIYAENDIMAYQYETIVEEVIRNYSSLLNTTDLKHEIDKVYQKHFVEQNDKIYTTQKENIDKVKTFENAIDTAEKIVEECNEQLEEYDKQLNEYYVQKEKREKNNGFSIIYIIVSASVAVCISAFLYVVNYIFSNRIKYADEIEELTNIKKLGTINEIDSVACILDVICKKNNIERCAMVWQKMSTNEQLEHTKEILQDKIFVKMYGENIDNKEMIQGLVMEEAVVIVVKLNHTKYQSINELVSVCMNCNLNIIGYIYE
ncbi:MAG: hypothetical protein U0L79_01975 [Lachnospiraceae bacterium]|nr:hypothetical protein [Lachnospiraceae bacterium]